MRREVSQPLLRSALIALGAGGGLMVAGSTLIDAAPASAQTILAASPHATGAGAPSHHGHPAAAHSSGKSHKGTVHAAMVTAPATASTGTTSEGPTTTQTALPAARAPSARPPTVASAGQSEGAAKQRALHAAALAAPAPASASGKATKGPRAASTKGPKAASTKRVKAASTKAKPARTAKPARPTKASPHPGRPAPVAPVPGTAGPVAQARPERLALPFSPLAFAPAAAGPGPTPLRSPGLPLPSIGLNPFHLPFGLPRGWADDTFAESAKLKVPLALLAAMAVFVLAQSLIDRRDPKLSRAPERQGEDSVGFQ